MSKSYWDGKNWHREKPEPAPEVEDVVEPEDEKPEDEEEADG